MKAANSTNMWIFTNGIDIGATKFIGDCIKKDINQMKNSNHNDEHFTCLFGVMREDQLRYGEYIGADGNVSYNLK
jgi:hypothetical protein